MRIRVLLFFFLILNLSVVVAQQKGAKNKADKVNEVYVDAKGVLRLQNGKAASYFGVNYTLPFAYGYRSHHTLKINIEKAIDQDVYHMARMGINAFRVHVWDTEISDSVGNLRDNEHLRLFDYLLAKLEERQIRIIITPIAFWGNGYPDQDEHTGSFGEKYGKEGAVVNQQAFAAQERYLEQFFRHVNPYTKKTYASDPFVIATEINNEPHHSGPQALTTAYVNRMMKAIQRSGWTKPVFYNISESPAYAAAVAQSDVNGFSFQWYPTGLVSGHTLQGNLMPNVDRYIIPFDTIPAFKNKARMIYEFDAADVLQPYMYPAMARSFKTAGFQWATQFAYDPMGTAFANTEYQTHYLNLAYTPAKAISLMIAAQVFHQVPLYQSYGSYPADTAFRTFKLSYHSQSSEMNADTAFYYANNSTSLPVQPDRLRHIAGVGSSPVVHYEGNGAYFLDQLSNDYWRLEVMPDVIAIHDPFDKTSLDKVVRRVVYVQHGMKILLSKIGADFTITALNEGNSYQPKVEAGAFDILPGTYLLRKSGSRTALSKHTSPGVIGLREFVAPSAGPAAMASETQLEKPAAADHQTTALPDSSMNGLMLFDSAGDNRLAVFNSPDWKTDPYAYVTIAGQKMLQMTHKPTAKTRPGGVEVFIKDKLENERLQSASAGNPAASQKVVIRASALKGTPVKIILIDGNGLAYSAAVQLGVELRDISIPLNDFRRDSFVLLPRPYPGFQAMDFLSDAHANLQLHNIEKIQFMIQGKPEDELSVNLANIRLETK